jgi:hypothetical protein
MMDHLTEHLFFLGNHSVDGRVFSDGQQLERHVRTIEQTDGRDAAAALRLKIEAAVRPLPMIDSNRR